MQGASHQALQWYLDHVSGTFDAVYIPATWRDPKTHKAYVAHLVFNVNRTIPIDLDKKGRTLRYENKNEMSANATSFD